MDISKNYTIIIATFFWWLRQLPMKMKNLFLILKNVNF